MARRRHLTGNGRSTDDRNYFAVRSLEEVAAIAYRMRDPETGQRLIPSPLKQTVANIERDALKKMALAAPELVEFLQRDGDPDTIEEARGRCMAASGA